MAYADSTTYFDIGDGSILGCFREKEFDNFFEFSEAPKNKTYSIAFPEFKHLVWVGPSLVSGTEFRHAKVLKTVAYVIVDEDFEGNPVIEKWSIKNFEKYEKRS